MCGFAGIYKNAPLDDAEKQAVVNMSQTIRHRGPDDNRIVTGETATLAFRRLSIIDLEKGSQPFETKDGRYVGIFNGEIYNYLELREELSSRGFTFDTRSEIETILTLYDDEGESFIKKLRGMFAICIYDKVQNTIFLGRDPFGIKPLYYRTNKESIVFSSESKAFFFDNTMNGFDIDNASLQHYFTFQYVPEPNTISTDIKILPAGHYVVMNSTLQMNPVSYHEFRFKPNKGISFDEKEKKLRRAVEQSIEYHMLSDVPVGSFLSSGIDSAIITAVASKLCPGIKAFTVAFGVKEYSEIENAEGISKHLDIDHIKLEAGLDEFLHAYERVVYHLDSPVADPSTVAIYLICEEAAKHVKVVLSGEGSDELFGGYKVYHSSVAAEKMLALPKVLRLMLRGLAKILPEGAKGKALIQRGTTPLEERYVGNAFIFDEKQKKPFYKKFDEAVRFTDCTKEMYARASELDMLTKMQHCDINTWLKGDILVKGDRLSMAHALEVRVPYLDKEVFEAARELCGTDKFQMGTTKYILRHAFRDLINSETVMRPKLGYPVPVRVWLKNELYDWAKGIITSPYADDYINKAYVLKLLEDHRAGKADNYRPLWTILVFITWYKLYIGEAGDTKQRILNGML